MDNKLVWGKRVEICKVSQKIKSVFGEKDDKLIYDELQEQLKSHFDPKNITDEEENSIWLDVIENYLFDKDIQLKNYLSDVISREDDMEESEFNKDYDDLTDKINICSELINEVIEIKNKASEIDTQSKSLEF